MGDMKRLVRLLLICCVVGVVVFSAVNNFWQPNSGLAHSVCTTGPNGGGVCHSVCDNNPGLEGCHHPTSGAEAILIVGGLGILIFGLLGAPTRNENRKRQERATPLSY